MTDQHLIFLGLLALPFGLSYLTTAGLRRWALRHRVIDVPTERSSHEQPTPRGGGMAIVLSFTIGMALAFPFFTEARRSLWLLLLSALGIALVGFLDDLRSISGPRRFAAWIVIAAVAMILGLRLEHIGLPVLGEFELGILSYPLTFIWLIGLANFYNFMDGIDGLAAGEAVIVGLFLAIISGLYGNTLVFITSLVLLGGSFGFLLHNLPPAKIFMGDGGSNFLGFTFAAIAILGSQSGEARVPFVIPVILLGTFLFDSTITLLKRIPKGRDWLRPHRDHFYQKLIILGYSHRQVTLLYCLLSLLLGGLAIVYARTGGYVALASAGAALVPLVAIATATKVLEAKTSPARLTAPQ